MNPADAFLFLLPTSIPLPPNLPNPPTHHLLHTSTCPPGPISPLRTLLLLPRFVSLYFPSFSSSLLLLSDTSVIVLISLFLFLLLFQQPQPDQSLLEGGFEGSEPVVAIPEGESGVVVAPHDFKEVSLNDPRGGEESEGGEGDELVAEDEGMDGDIQRNSS